VAARAGSTAEHEQVGAPRDLSSNALPAEPVTRCGVTGLSGAINRARLTASSSTSSAAARRPW
jgi:hypothetical protein